MRSMNKFFLKRTSLWILFSVLTLLAGCGSGGGGSSSSGGGGGSSSGGSTAATLTSIAVTPANPSTTVGGTQQFTATGNYSDGITQDITTQVTWTSDTQNVATITTAGLATGVSAGSSTITATSGLLSGNTTISVTAVVLAPNAQMLDTITTSSISSVSSDGNTVVFSSATSQTASLKSGDVIISGITTATPKGLLRKVISSTIATDGTVSVTTEPALLTDAFQELHLSGSVTSANSVATYSKSIGKALTVTTIPEFSYTIPSVPFDISAGQGNMTVSGTYTFKPVLDYEIGVFTIFCG